MVVPRSVPTSQIPAGLRRFDIRFSSEHDKITPSGTPRLGMKGCLDICPDFAKHPLFLSLPYHVLVSVGDDDCAVYHSAAGGSSRQRANSALNTVTEDSTIKTGSRDIRSAPRSVRVCERVRKIVKGVSVSAHVMESGQTSSSPSRAEPNCPSVLSQSLRIALGPIELLIDPLSTASSGTN